MRKLSYLGLFLTFLIIPSVIWAIDAENKAIPKFEKLDLSDSTAYSITRVVDGDTIIANIDGKDTTIRLIGVDTPETVHPSKSVQYYGKEASNFTKNLLQGEKVYLVTDPQQGKTDRYGRTLAYVYRAPGGLFVNAEIIRQGYGHAYGRYPFKYLEEFRRLEKFSRDAEKGLWEVRQITKFSSKSPLMPTVVKPKSDTDNVTVYITRTGKKYHRGSCSYLRRSKIPKNLSDARAAGYGPCSRCGPPR